MKEMICIGCPMGCELTVTPENGGWAVTGNQCNIGARYAREEMTNPTRNVTTSVRITGGDMPMLSVKTVRPVPKDKIMDCVNAIKGLKLTAPVNLGDVVLSNAAGTGADIAATRSVAAAD